MVANVSQVATGLHQSGEQRSYGLLHLSFGIDCVAEDFVRGCVTDFGFGMLLLALAVEVGVAVCWPGS